MFGSSAEVTIDLAHSPPSQPSTLHPSSLVPSHQSEKLLSTLDFSQSSNHLSLLLQRKSAKVDTLKATLKQLRAAVAFACSRLNAAHKLASYVSFRSPFPAIPTRSDLSAAVLEELLGPIDVGEARGEELLRRAASELKDTFYSMRCLWADFFSETHVENQDNEPLFQELEAFFQDVEGTFPFILSAYDSALRIHALLQRLLPSSTTSRYTDSITMRTLTNLLLDIERNLNLLAADKSAFETPKSVSSGNKERTRSRISFSSNEKLFKEEVDGLERAKFDIQVQELTFEVEQLREIQCLERVKMEEMRGRTNELEDENRSLRDKIVSLEIAIESLQRKLTSLRTFDPSKVLPPPSEVHSKLDELDQSIKDLLVTMQNEKREMLLPCLHNILEKHAEKELSAYFVRWKAMCFAGNWREESGEDPLRLWKTAVIQRNPLLECVTKGDNYMRTPMPPLLIYKTFDELMIRKAEAHDSLSSFPAFTIAYLAEKLGARAAAIRTLRQALPTLLAFTEDEFYGQFLARMLQLHSPISNSVADFFVKINYAMYELVMKRNALKADETERFRTDVEFVDPASGGKILLSDALDLLYSLPLSKDADLCRRVLNYLRSGDMDKRDYVLFVVSHKLYSSSLHVPDLFEATDSSLPLSVFLNTLKSKLALCLSEKKLYVVFHALRPTGRITFLDFKKLLSPQYYHLNMRNDRYTVDRFYFLYALSFAYDYTVDRTVEILRSLYEGSSQEEWELCFQRSLASVIDPGDEAKLRELMKEVKEIYGEGPLNEDHFLSFVAFKEFGGYFVEPFQWPAIRSRESSPRKRERTEVASQSRLLATTSPTHRQRNHTIVGVNFLTSSV